MPTPPSQPRDINELIGNLQSGQPAGTALALYGADRIRPAVHTRNLVQWFVPEKGVVEMYVNPQQVSYQYKKQITNQRTKGGYLLQYWGEELTTLNIQGTTGSSSIEGINVLMDVYRNEQVQFDPYALALASDRSRENEEFSFLGDFPTPGLGQTLTNIGSSIGESFVDMVSNAVETGSPKTTRPSPTLASLAFTVEMYYANWSFRGYFTDFRIDERADRLGLFDYTMTFMVTQQRGIRQNYFGWQRSPDGPSNSDPIGGRPYSYNALVSEYAAPTQRPNQNDGKSLVDLLKSSTSLISSEVSSTFSSIF